MSGSSRAPHRGDTAGPPPGAREPAAGGYAEAQLWIWLAVRVMSARTVDRFCVVLPAVPLKVTVTVATSGWPLLSSVKEVAVLPLTLRLLTSAVSAPPKFVPPP